MAFQAKIRLGNMKRAPLSHSGYRGRMIKKGDSFTTTNPEEAAYYRAQPGFSVTLLKGKLASHPVPVAPPDPDPAPDSDEESEDDERPEEVDGIYEEADLKKMNKLDLMALIDDSDELPLSSEDVPRGASKQQIIDLILAAQEGDTEDDEEEDDEED